MQEEKKTDRPKYRQRPASFCASAGLQHLQRTDAAGSRLDTNAAAGIGTCAKRKRRKIRNKPKPERRAVLRLELHSSLQNKY